VRNNKDCLRALRQAPKIDINFTEVFLKHLPDGAVFAGCNYDVFGGRQDTIDGIWMTREVRAVVSKLLPVKHV
jgi:hypothetical protein